jgi:hypothetical protein
MTPVLACFYVLISAFFLCGTSHVIVKVDFSSCAGNFYGPRGDASSASAATIAVGNSLRRNQAAAGKS